MGVAKISKSKVPTMRALKSEGAAAGNFPTALLSLSVTPY